MKYSIEENEDGKFEVVFEDGFTLEEVFDTRRAAIRAANEFLAGNE